jgi:hypothetical protein
MMLRLSRPTSRVNATRLSIADTSATSASSEQQRVKSCETQQRGKLAQMDVEVRSAPAVEDHAARARPVISTLWKARVHRYVITILHAVAEVCSVSVDDDDVDFGMGTPSASIDILHRGGAAERVPEAAVAQWQGQGSHSAAVEPEPGHTFRLGSDRPCRRRNPRERRAGINVAGASTVCR